LVHDRFFATTQLKTILAHFVINYDIKPQTPGIRTPDIRSEFFKVPDPRGKIWIKKRE
jgi:hypothetical protein